MSFLIPQKYDYVGVFMHSLPQFLHFHIFLLHSLCALPSYSNLVDLLIGLELGCKLFLILC